MTEGGHEAVRADDEVVPAADVSAVSKSACANWNASSGARPWKSRSSRKPSTLRGQKSDLAVAL